MASRLIQFPSRNPYAPIRSHDSLARDTQAQACRIAEQVEQELARQAQRQAVGFRIEMVNLRAATLDGPTNLKPWPSTPISPFRAALQTLRTILRNPFKNLRHS